MNVRENIRSMYISFHYFLKIEYILRFIVFAITYFLFETSSKRQKFVKDSNKHNLISELKGVVNKKKHRWDQNDAYLAQFQFGRTSLVIQWLGLVLPMQGMWVWSLVTELRAHMLLGQNNFFFNFWLTFDY